VARLGVVGESIELKPASPPPNPNGAGVELPIDALLPNIETRSSRGLEEVPDSRLAAAGVCARTSVAARPDG
jgi:hypothetical protein